MSPPPLPPPPPCCCCRHRGAGPRLCPVQAGVCHPQQPGLGEGNPALTTLLQIGQTAVLRSLRISSRLLLLMQSYSWERDEACDKGRSLTLLHPPCSKVGTFLSLASHRHLYELQEHHPLQSQEGQAVRMLQELKITANSH